MAACRKILVMSIQNSFFNVFIPLNLLRDTLSIFFSIYGFFNNLQDVHSIKIVIKILLSAKILDIFF